MECAASSVCCGGVLQEWRFCSENAASLSSPFSCGPSRPIPSRNTILRRVQNLRLTASATNKSPPGRIRNMRTPQNIDRVREAVIQSPRRSTMKQAAALRISDRSVQRILHLDLHGATPHTAQASMALVRRLFPGHVISRFGDLPWPPRSPDQSICDYFLWGYLKSRVYVNRPQTLDELKHAITRDPE